MAEGQVEGEVRVLVPGSGFRVPVFQGSSVPNFQFLISISFRNRVDSFGHYEPNPAFGTFVILTVAVLKLRRIV